MSVRHHVTLACDCCGVEGVVIGRTAEDVRAGQRRIGWITDAALGGDWDKCPRCEFHTGACGSEGRWGRERR
jgi:hypothetical protein